MAEIDGKLEHTYDIKIAKSKNLISWNIWVVAIGQNNFEQAITRPTVIKINKKYHMWFALGTVVTLGMVKVVTR